MEKQTCYLAVTTEREKIGPKLFMSNAIDYSHEISLKFKFPMVNK